MSDFKFIAGSGTGGFGFRTVGSDYEYTAIKNFKAGADQGLIFQTRTHSTSTHTERMRIATDGKVGIGTTSPSGQLIHGKIDTSGSDPMLKLEQAGSGDSTLNFIRSSGVHQASIGSLATDGSFNISLQHNIRGNIKLKLDNNSRISLSNNDSGTVNTVFGYLAGNSIGAGNSHNVAIGHEAFNFILIQVLTLMLLLVINLCMSVEMPQIIVLIQMLQ